MRTTQWSHQMVVLLLKLGPLKMSRCLRLQQVERGCWKWVAGPTLEPLLISSPKGPIKNILPTNPQLKAMLNFICLQPLLVVVAVAQGCLQGSENSKNSTRKIKGSISSQKDLPFEEPTIIYRSHRYHKINPLYCQKNLKKYLNLIFSR